MSADWRGHADDVLRGAGLKASAGRSAVIDLLARETCVLTPQQVVARLDGTASQATVYRALDTLQAYGLVRRFDAGDGLGRYEVVDPSGEHHHHVVFDDGAVEPFADAQLEAALAGVGERLGLRLTGHEVILRARRP
jgi:Fur family transcriptional regulator, ferric uptake regulator